MRVIIAIECKGDEPESELSHVLNEVAEKGIHRRLVGWWMSVEGIRRAYDKQNVY